MERGQFRDKTLRARELVGKEIIAEEGMIIGTAKDLLIDAESWRVNAVEATLAKNVAKEFGVRKILRSTDLPIKVEDIRAVGDKIALKITKTQLQASLEAASPTKTAGQEPGPQVQP